MAKPSDRPATTPGEPKTHSRGQLQRDVISPADDGGAGPCLHRAPYQNYPLRLDSSPEADCSHSAAGRTGPLWPAYSTRASTKARDLRGCQPRHHICQPQSATLRAPRSSRTSVHLLPSGAATQGLCLGINPKPTVLEQPPSGRRCRMVFWEAGMEVPRRQKSGRQTSIIHSVEAVLFSKTEVWVEITPSSVAPPNHPWRSPLTDPWTASNQPETHRRGQLQRDVMWQRGPKNGSRSGLLKGACLVLEENLSSRRFGVESLGSDIQ
jgi:hypothetical protein